MTGTTPYRRNLYGRKQTRPPKGERLEALETLLPSLQIKLEDGEQLNPASLFPRSFKSIWLEIGFGNGEHLVELMRRHPDRAYIGAEPFINGMSAFLKDIAADPHDNIRVW